MKSISVIGGLVIDIILRVNELPKPGQSIFSQEVINDFGGKGMNASIAASKLGASVKFCGYVGNDDNGRLLIDVLRKHGIDTANIHIGKHNTGIAYIVSSSDSENFIIGTPIIDVAFNDMNEQVLEAVKSSEIILITAELSHDFIEKTVHLCCENNKKVIIDTGPMQIINPKIFRGAFCISPNKSELEAIVGYRLDSDKDIIDASIHLLNFEIQNIVVKLGERGCILVNNEKSVIVDSYKVNAIDSTAAGDSFIAGLCCALCEGNNMIEAVSFANKCGALTVTQLGSSSSTPSRKDIQLFTQSNSKKIYFCK